MNLEGQQFGEFTILERIGQGGMGAVYKASQTSLERLVALKTLQTSLAENAEFISRFRQEAKAAAKLMHPNLVQVFSAGETEGLHWFAMEYVEGESAKGRLQRKGRLDPLEAIAIVLHVATALEYGWKKAQLIHRDVKPDNIFLSHEGEVKLGDLGLAKSAGQTQGLTMTGTSMGSPHYISPEQAQAMKTVDFRADIYSLGCTLYHFLAGRPAYEGDSPVAIMLKHVSAPVPDLHSVWFECPPDLAAVVMKMMLKAPDDRSQSYAELIAELRRIYGALSGHSVPEVVAVTHARPPQERPFLTAEPTARAEVAPILRAAPGVGTAVKNRRSLGLYAGIGAGVLALAAAFFLVPKLQLGHAPGPGSSASPPAGEAGASQTSAFPSKSLGTRKKANEANGGQRSVAAQTSAGDGGEKVGADGAAPSNATKDAPFVNTGMPTPRIWNDATVSTRASVDSKFTKGTASYQGNITIDAPKLTDVALRVRGQHLTLKLRKSGSDQIVGAVTSLGGSSIYVPDPSKPSAAGTLLAKADPPPGFDNHAIHELIFAARGADLSLWIDGQLMVQAKDPHPIVGEIGVLLEGSTVIEKLEWAKLDPLENTPTPTLTVATKDAPFVNSLGMKFVPVPITGGPTNGQRVLFSVWETRVQDYEAFAKETQHTWPKPGFEQGPAHPACMVNFEDAHLFCQWLTNRDRKAGKIGANEAYRLPSDHEWSCAVGLGKLEDPLKMPEKKSRQLAGQYPWGTAWPPPANAGNYSGEEVRGSGAPADRPILAGFNDGYPNTAPVGSFAANPLGLYDLGGNIREMCEDLFNATDPSKGPSVRGSSFNDGNPAAFLSSNRAGANFADRVNYIGFRCVLAPVTAPRPAPGTSKSANGTPPLHRMERSLSS